MAEPWKPSFIDRMGAKALWKVLEVRMPWIKCWLPFIGTVLVVAVALLRALGHPEVADTILSVARLIPGLDVTADQVLATAAVTSTVGLVLQGWSRFQKARGRA